jgi:hypothetical protein
MIVSPYLLALRACVAFAALVTAVPASAQLEVRANGRSWARIEEDGTVRIDGRMVGRIEPDGSVRRDGRLVGATATDGSIRASGRTIGRVERDGTVRRSGRAIGRIEPGGKLRLDGRTWGTATNCCGDYGSKRTVAALLAFFGSEWF